MKAILLAAAAAAALSACTIREARIAMPSNLAASSERLVLSGMGGGRSGRFQIAGANGTFHRTADRLGMLDPLFVRHSGGGRFEVGAAPGIAALDGRCSYREGQVNAGPIAVTPRRLAFHCAFGRDGRPIAAELAIADPQGPLGTLHGRAEREGVLYFEGETIEIRSIHRDRGGGLPNPTALGYLFSVGGQAVGAVDLNGGDKTIYAPVSGPRREAVLAAALALSILWDPAIVQPGS
jgi:hypothetical protein